MLDKETLVTKDIEVDMPKDPIVAMEFASFNGLNDRLLELIEENSRSDKLSNQEWARIYKLFYQRNMLNIKGDSIVKAVQYQNSDHPEMFVAYRLLHAYGCYDQTEFGVLCSVFKILIEEIDKLKDSHLEPFYRIRLRQLLTNIYFRQNDLDKARDQAQIIINQCPTYLFVASAYHTLGLSYLYEDYEKGISALEESLNLYVTHQNKGRAVQVKKSIIFYSNYWGIDKNYMIFSNQNRDTQERAHFEIRQDNKDKARDILKSIDFESLSLQEKGFYYFYKGLAIDSIDNLYKSIEAFKKIEDKFAANMARLELYRRGERQAAIEAAYN
jgi:tetratricopeptide (TPR) repeat protein